MAVLTSQAQVVGHRSALSRAGLLLVAAGLSFILYFVVSATFGAAYEKDLSDAAKAAGTTIEQVPPADAARINQKYPTYALISGLIIALPAGVLMAGLHSGRRALRDTGGASLVAIAWWLGLGATTLWYVYFALNAGLEADPDNLPFIVRDLDVITVPLFDVMSVLALGGLAALAMAARKAGIAPKTTLASIIVACVIMIAGSALSIVSGLESSLPPPAWLPPALILGVGLLRSRASGATPTHS